MATQPQIDNLKKLSDELKSIKGEQLLRPQLGEESLKSEFGPKLEIISQKLGFALEFAPEVHDTYLNPIYGTFNNIVSALKTQSKRNNAEYVSQRKNFLNTITTHIEELKIHWAQLISVAVEKRGFLQDEGIRKEYQRTVDAMKKESNTIIQQLKEESTKALEGARKLAQEIEAKARRTATKISVEEAQKQFKEAQQDCNTRVWIWALLSIGSIGTFIGIAFYLASVKLPPEWQWHEVVYYTAIRIVILSAVGAVAGFCLGILRAYLHMKQHNLHRQRVANSMASFIESAVTQEQRDLILSQLVDAIVNFGSSGLLSKKSDTIYTPKMSIDTISRTFTPPTANP